MTKIGIIYGTEGQETKKAAEKIRDRFGGDLAECRSIEDVSIEEMSRYPHLIFGTPTEENGDLPDDWKENFGKLHLANLEGKDIALFGLGDQDKYPDHFADALGILAKEVVEKGGRIVGSTPADGYSYRDSAAMDHGTTISVHAANAPANTPPEGQEVRYEGNDFPRFIGLVLDQEHQPDKTEKRIETWVQELRQEFRL